MAKKSGAKKASKKSSGKGGAKGSPAMKKGGTKKAAPKKGGAKKRGSSGGEIGNAGMPPKVTSGRGATPAELGAQLVNLFNQNKADEWIKGVWDKNIRSIEGDGMLFVGVKSVLEKWAWWSSRTEVLGASAEGPYVGADAFSVKFTMHTRDKESGKEMHMTEVGVYNVKDGKITQEQFMYFCA